MALTELRRIDKKYPDSFFNPRNFFVIRDRFDYGPFPIPYYFIHWLGKRAEKYYGAKLGSVLACSKGAFHQGLYRNIFGSKKDWDNWTSSVLKKTVTNPAFTKNTCDKSIKIGKEFKNFSKKLLRLDFNDISVRELINLHKEWIEKYAEYSFWNVPIWFGTSDQFAKYVINLLSSKYDCLPEEIQTLTTCPYPSYTFQEELDLIKIATKPKKMIKNLLIGHEAKWRWLPFDYIGPTVWTRKDFLKRLESLTPNPKEARKVLQRKENYHKELQFKQKKIIQKLNINSKDQNLLSDLRLITLMQDQKKEICTFAQFVLHKVIFAKISELTGIKPVECVKFHHEELWQAINGRNKNLKKDLLPRLEAITVILEVGGMTILSGHRAKGIFDKFTPKLRSGALKGQIASSGIARGRAKVLITPTQVTKIKKGDIMIAPMTTPDYVLGMKKAAAIVTDEGGMTSHAAIVSRELGIPCVVGTKIATKVFKDGDLVEVDANKGIVRLLRKAR